MRRGPRWLLHLRPETLVLVVFVSVLLAIRLAYGGGFTPDKLTAKVPLIVLAGIVFAAFVPRLGTLLRGDPEQRATTARRAWGMVHDWIPFIVCILIYENLHDTVKLIHPETLDEALAYMDEWIFGVQPTVWLQRWTTPWFTDVMAFCYGSYFFTPTILGGLLYVFGRRAEFRELMLTVVATLYSGFLGYVIVPAIGPRHYLRWVYEAPQTLKGLVLYDKTAAILDDLQAVNRDCFPSLHTGISTVTLVLAWRYRDRIPYGRVLFAVYLPLTLGLWLSTVYLRYHWVVDLFAGWALAALTTLLIPLLVRGWDERRRRIGLPPIGGS